MPKNKTTTINFRRAVTLEAITTPLAEGVTPKTTAFRYDIVEGTLKQYGMVMGLTDVIEDTHEDPVLNDMTMVCGENAGRSAEALTYGVLKAGTNVRYANGTQRSDVNTVLSLGHQRAVIRDLKAQKAMKVSRMLAPGSAYGTSAVESAYIGICHTDLENDIRNLPRRGSASGGSTVGGSVAGSVAGRRVRSKSDMIGSGGAASAAALPSVEGGDGAGWCEGAGCG